jgi:hypothetical protein
MGTHARYPGGDCQLPVLTRFEQKSAAWSHWMGSQQDSEMLSCSVFTP